MSQPKINDTVRTDIENSVLCWLATVSADGKPNVSPKEMFAAYGDDCLVIGNIASPNSIANIRENTSVCVSFVDVFRQKGFKIEGEATIIAPDDPQYAVVGKDILVMAGESYPIKHVIKIQIDRISRIWAPSYAIFPDRSEEARIQSGYDVYGVRPA